MKLKIRSAKETCACRPSKPEQEPSRPRTQLNLGVAHCAKDRPYGYSRTPQTCCVQRSETTQSAENQQANSRRKPIRSKMEKRKLHL